MSGNIDSSFEKALSDNESQCCSCEKYSKVNDNKNKSKELPDSTNNSGVQNLTRFQSSTDSKVLSSSYYSSDSSENSDCDKCYIVNKAKTKEKKLPPIGVFWDIENCQVPKGRSAVAVAQLIRDLFFTGFREAEFIVVCDVKKENGQIIQELNDAQVTLVHVSSTCKNAADEKLRQVLRRFADTYNAPAAVILISGDVNFAADLSDLRHRKKLHVILIHKENASEALILCATEHYNYTNITQSLPLKENKINPSNEAMEVIVRNLPISYDLVRLKNRLKQLSDNCGGRVVYVSSDLGVATIRFYNMDIAIRAQRRMDGEDVYGNKISVSYPNSVRNWEKSYSPYKLPARRLAKSAQEMYMHSSNYGVVPYSAAPTYQQMEYYNMSHPIQNIPQKNFMDRSAGNMAKSQQEPGIFHSGEQYNFKNDFKSMNQPMTSTRPVEAARSIRGVHGGGSMLMDHNQSSNEYWRPHSSSFSEGQRRSKTPNESTLQKQSWSRNISGSFTSLNMLENVENENNLQPLNTFQRSNSTSNNSSPGPVDLLVTNLDQSMNPDDLKSLLICLFQEHAMVISMSLFHQSDGNLVANVRVNSVQDAQYVISQLHRRKVGHKRILISNAQSSSTNPHVLRSQVTALLQEVPGNRMPLFKFRELLETRYRSSVSVSELYKLRDVCSVSDELGGRMITLCPDLRTTPSPHPQWSQCGLESPHCLRHCPNGLEERGWAEPEIPSLPNVRIKLKLFGKKVHEMLHSHMGNVPLPSFPVCYEIENGEKLPIDETGVPLEHLITCIVGVDLRLSSNNVKYIVWGNQLKGDELNNDDMNSASSVCGASNSAAMKCVSPPLQTQLALFSRELVDLLKTASHCQLPFSRFIPAYHHHFGRQCRVADYGHTKLVDLFDSLSHIVQIIGEGNQRIITLSHSAQIRRFTSDLLRVLKSQASKQVTLSEFGAAYERALSRSFDPVDYGLCDLSDLLDEVSENTIVIKQFEDDIIIAIPKREQTNDEILKTKQFSVEVVDLLRHAPQYGMLFNKFVPAYHHHFGHQCRVSDYGFTKLIELFEAIPNVVKIEERSDGERRVSLTPAEALKVVRQQIISLIKSSRLQSVPLVALPATFLREHGYPLRADLYECASTKDLINKLSDSLQLVSGPAGPMVIVAEETAQQHLGLRIWALLLKYPHSESLSNLLHIFFTKYGYPCTLQQIEKYNTILEIKTRTNGDIEVTLTPRYALAARLYHLLYENGGTLLFGNVDGMYLRKYGKVLRPAEYDATTLNALLSQFSFLFIVRGRRNKRNVSLNTSITALGIPLPLNMKYHFSDSIYGNSSNNIQWPPPPAHTYLFNSGRTAASPPKPDTPPAHGTSHWDNSMWSPSPNFAASLNLCIPLPFMQTPPLMSNPGELISPMKNLLPAYPSENQVLPPDPSELPMPTEEFINKAKVTSPSKDSGISSTSFCNSMEEPDSSTTYETENLTPKKKRHLRLAAQFTTPLNLP